MGVNRLPLYAAATRAAPADSSALSGKVWEASARLGASTHSGDDMGLLDRLRGTPSAEVAVSPSPVAEQPTFAVIDVETTGLSPTACRVLELAVVLTDPNGSPVWEWSSRFNPQGPVGPTHIHGITDADVAHAPLLADHLTYLADLLGGRVLVAHNAEFDLAFLAAEYHRAGWDMPEVPRICTMQAGRVYLPDLPRHRLGDCCDACGVPHTEVHSALGDARATAAMLATYLTRTPDRGAWLEWESAFDEARRITWPTKAVRPPIEFSPDPQTRMWANMSRSREATPALVEVVAGMDLGDALDEGAPDGSLEYLELLAEALQDGILDALERDSLGALAEALGLSSDDVLAAHEAFLRSLANAALFDGKVTRAEKNELENVAAALDQDTSLVPRLVDSAEKARLARLSDGLGPLPQDWTHGEPLRVGDKVVFTGCEAYGRDELEARSARLGVRVIGSVSRRVALLVSDGTIDGTKASDARALGIRTVHPDEYDLLLNHLQPALVPVTRAPKQPSVKATPAGTETVQGAAAHRPGSPTLTSPVVPPSTIRAWARDNGYDVGDRGRLHADVISAFHRANGTGVSR